MSNFVKKQATEAEQPQEALIKKLRITLAGRDHRALERVCADLVREAKNKQLRVKGPVRLPTKVLRIVTRKSPCGEGTNTWDRFEMRVHKRLIDLHNISAATVKDITSINMEANVDVEVTICE